MNIYEYVEFFDQITKLMLWRGEINKFKACIKNRSEEVVIDEKYIKNFKKIINIGKVIMSMDYRRRKYLASK